MVVTYAKRVMMHLILMAMAFLTLVINAPVLMIVKTLMRMV